MRWATRRAAAHLPAAHGLRRGRHSRAAVPVLPARHDGFQPNIFTPTIPGINDGVAPTAANGANHDRPTIGAVRLVLEPKPGLPTDPNDPGAFIDIFTDISGLFVINNESRLVRGLDDPRPRRAADRRATAGRPRAFGTMTHGGRRRRSPRWASGNNVPGHVFTDRRQRGAASRAPRITSRTGDATSCRCQLSMGAYNCLQQSDCHAYWEFNEYTNWVFPAVRAAVHRRRSGDSVRGRACSTTCLSLIAGLGSVGHRRTDRAAGNELRRRRRSRTIRATRIAAPTRARGSRSADGEQRRSEGDAAALRSERTRERGPARRLRAAASRSSRG